MRHILVIALLVLVHIGCGSSVGQVEPADGATMPAEPSPAPPQLIENVDWSDEGTRLLDSGGHVWQSGQFVRLLPVAWPDDPIAGERPTLGTGIVHISADNTASITLWDAIPGTRGLALHAEPVPGPVALVGTKRLAVVERVTDESTITIAEGLRSGVAPNDVYFVLNAEGDTTRLGTWIGALAIVSDADENSATLRVQHADVPVEAGDLVLFVQSRFEHVIPEGTLLFAPLEPDAAFTGMPELATAVPQYMADYGISNVSIGTFSNWVDPAPYDAFRTVEGLAPSEGFGGAVYGHWNPPNLTLGLTVWGRSPTREGAANTLPAGMTIPAPDGLGALSEQLAPGFLATVLALRGDHAVAIYVLESALRRTPLHEQIRFHFREHLVLRWRSLEYLDQAWTIANEDVRDARNAEGSYALLNALSVLSYVGWMRATPAVQLELVEEPIALSEGVLPEQWRLYLRVHRLRILEDLGDPGVAAGRAALFDEAIALGETNAAFHLRLDSLLGEDFTPAELGTFVRQQDVWRGQVEPADWLRFVLGVAERWLELEQFAQADLYIGLAQTLLQHNEPPRFEAGLRARLASLLFGRERYDEAIREYSRASTLYLEGLDCFEALRNLDFMMMAEFRLFQQLEGDASIEVIRTTETHLQLASQLGVNLGNPVSAANFYRVLSHVQLRMPGSDTGQQSFENALNHLLRAGQLGRANELLESRASALEFLGSTEEAAVLRERAMRWATAAAVSGR